MNIREAWRVLWGRAPSHGQRMRLPTHRESETFKYEFATFKWYATISRFPNGQIGEIFLATAKTGEMLRIQSTDSAILASLAMQYGCPLNVMLDAMSRNERGEVVSPIAMALETVSKNQ